MPWLHVGFAFSFTFDVHVAAPALALRGEARARLSLAPEPCRVCATLSIIQEYTTPSTTATSTQVTADQGHTSHGPPHTTETRERRVRSTHTIGDERLYARTSPGIPGAEAGAHSDADSLSQATMKHAPELFACIRLLGISGDLASLWRVWLWRMLSRHRCTGRCRGQQPCTSRCRRTERRPPSGPGSGAWGSK